MNIGFFIGGLLAGTAVVGAWVHWSLPAEARAPIPRAAPAEALVLKPRSAPVPMVQVELRDLAALSAWHRGYSEAYAYQMADRFLAARGPSTPAMICQ